MEKFTVVRQDWIEKERGWGFRPDGYTLHLSEEDRKAFIKAYWDKMPDEAPDEYSSPDIVPKVVEVDAERYQALQKQRTSEKPFGISRYGLWY